MKDKEQIQKTLPASNIKKLDRKYMGILVLKEKLKCFHRKQNVSYFQAFIISFEQ